MLLDLDYARPTGSAVLASACKILGANSTPDGVFRFHAEGPDKTEAVVRVALPEAPTHVELDGSPLHPKAKVWDFVTKTLLLRFDNSATGRIVAISCQPADSTTGTK